MNYFLALLPILIVLVMMLVFRSGSHTAGLAGWIAGLAVAFFAFGLNMDVLWVSQVKSLLVTFNVLLVIWPALLLYHLVDQAGGIRAIALALEGFIPDRGWLLIVEAWMLTGIIENLAGFGLPIAIASPLLMALGVTPLVAVAASAIGHSWAVTMSGMALAFRTLADVTGANQAELFPTTVFLLGIVVLLTGLAVTFVLKQKQHWWRTVLLGVFVAGVQYVTCLAGLIPVASFVAGFAGILGGTFLSHKPDGWKLKFDSNPELKTGLLSYGFLIAAMLVVTVIPPVNRALSSLTWTLNFPAVTSGLGFSTAAARGFVFRFLIHPGVLMLVTCLFAVLVIPRFKGLPIGQVKPALSRMVKAAIPASLGTLFMIALSALMEHTGMTLKIAEGLSKLMGLVYPLFSPLVGMIGAFATGSNTNSNVLFGAMQKGVAQLLGISPLILLAAQTVGGSLGSMVAPAKLAVGGTTTGLKGREGEVLRITLPIGLALVLIVGVAALLLIGG
jgi:lactate permease